MKHGGETAASRETQQWDSGEENDDHGETSADETMTTKSAQTPKEKCGEEPTSKEITR